MFDADIGLRALQSEMSGLMPPFRVRYEPEYVLVTLTGEIDFSVVVGLREQLFALADAGHQMVVDLDRVSFIDAAGLGVLAGAARRAGAHGASVHVVCARRRTRRLFRFTRLDRTVLLSGSMVEALQLLVVTPDLAAAAV